MANNKLSFPKIWMDNKTSRLAAQKAIEEETGNVSASDVELKYSATELLNSPNSMDWVDLGNIWPLRELEVFGLDLIANNNNQKKGFANTRCLIPTSSLPSTSMAKDSVGGCWKPSQRPRPRLFMFLQEAIPRLCTPIRLVISMSASAHKKEG